MEFASPEKLISLRLLIHSKETASCISSNSDRLKFLLALKVSRFPKPISETISRLANKMVAQNMWRVKNKLRRSFSLASAALEAARVFIDNTAERIRAFNADGPRLLVLDNVFPSLLSAFRVAEFNYYLDHFPRARVLSTGTALPLLGERRRLFEVISQYESVYPCFKGRAKPMHPDRDMSANLVYTVFASNAQRFIRVAEKQGIPFAFTLYPGGGFLLDNPESDEALVRIFGSPSFRRVIVTQKITEDYIISRGLCPTDAIDYIFGLVVPEFWETGQTLCLPMPSQENKPLEICFVAHKYMKGGIDKGFDVFCKAAAKLSRHHRDIHFHVVGNFTPADTCGMGGALHRIVFHGAQPTSFFHSFYKKMDIILSPNLPFAAKPGVFDGFPTGCCVEAAMNGVLVMCSDPLSQNTHFADGKEIIIVSRDVENVCDRIAWLNEDREALYRIRRSGTEAFRRIYSIESQMVPRMRALNQCLIGA